MCLKMCLKQIAGCLCCVVVLAVGGVLLWRFGPWYEDSLELVDAIPWGGGGDGGDDGDAIDLRAATACEGCCNGRASNCDLPADQVAFAMVHNAHSSRADLFAGYNNKKSLEEALVAGYRGLMLDSCVCDGSIGEKIQSFLKGEDNGENSLGFCHKSCDAGVRNPEEVLGNIMTFLDVNKNEVLILEFEINDDSLAGLSNALDASGLDDYLYRPTNPQAPWPTLRSLINSDQRLILMAHGDGTEGCPTAPDCPDVLYTFDYLAQTDWNDDTCDVRGPNDRRLFLMNHWMNNEETDLPSEANAETFNAYNQLVERVRKCTGRAPNVVAVDFWDVGDVLRFVDDLNAKQAAGR